MFFAHAVAMQWLFSQRSPFGHGFDAEHTRSLTAGSMLVHLSGDDGLSRHTMSNVMPAACSCVRQPRAADLRDTKSSVSEISCPERYMTTIVFSNGNTLNICSFVSGPRSKSARTPSEFVNA